MISQRRVFSVMKYKVFFLNNKNHIKETDGIFDVITAKCIVNISIKFRESEFQKGVFAN